MINIEIGTAAVSSTVVAQSTDTVREVFTRNGKAGLLSGNVTVKIARAGSASRTVSNLDSSLESLGVQADDFILVSENLKSA